MEIVYVFFVKTLFTGGIFRLGRGELFPQICISIK